MDAFFEELPIIVVTFYYLRKLDYRYFNVDVDDSSRGLPIVPN
uniref:Uncharacterized protein n=1 Tax=Physcomitrium patens TaxID=3218 RepID=A0A2K1JEC5_PHYPA|nr:hypothetical protein PHYPA_020162 [Physcomitrium patens]